MTGRERLTRVYRGQLADRVPWAPLTDEPMEVLRRVGADILGRCSIVSWEHHGYEYSWERDKTNSALFSEEYRTKLGSIRAKKHGCAIVEPLLETPQSFEILKYVYEHNRYVLDIDKYLAVEKEIGNDGISAVVIGDTPVQSLVQNQMGVEGFAYALCDYPSELEALMQSMHNSNKEMYKLVAQSPAEVVIMVENTSTTMISPDIYRKYSMGHVKDFVDIMHANGKVACVHMCGLIKDLLPLIKNTGLDAIDCLTPPPTGNVDFRDAYRIIGGHLTIHGLLDPTQWLQASCSVDHIKEAIRELLKPDVIDKPFVLCTASDGMPGVPLEKYEAIGQTMREYVF